VSSASRVGFNPLTWFHIDGGFNRAAAPPIDVMGEAPRLLV
jgi:hypothetical protein